MSGSRPSDSDDTRSMHLEGAEKRLVDRARSQFEAASSAAGEDRPPPEIPGYTLLRRLEGGGMGTVYLAHDPRLDRSVAIKTLQASAGDPERLAMLRREAQLAARLRHPNIVAIHAFLDSSDPACVVMEWIEGTTFGEFARRVDCRTGVRILQKVARAVAYAHRAGVVHRDLKPENIVVDGAGEPRLLSTLR